MQFPINHTAVILISLQLQMLESPFSLSTPHCCPPPRLPWRCTSPNHGQGLYPGKSILVFSYYRSMFSTFYIPFAKLGICHFKLNVILEPCIYSHFHSNCMICLCCRGRKRSRGRGVLRQPNCKEKNKPNR